MVDWKWVCQKNQTQINKYNLCENSKRVYHDYRVGYRATLDINDACKYETLYKGQFVMKQCCTNGNVSLQGGAIKLGYNIRHIKPHKSDTHIEDNKC